MHRARLLLAGEGYPRGEGVGFESLYREQEIGLSSFMEQARYHRALEAELEDAVSWQAQPLDLKVVYEDSDIIVVDKPPGLVVHPAAGHRQDTLVNALLHVYPELASLPRAGIVHRLDKDTSGLMVVARSLRAHTSLVEQLQSRTVRREYAAVCVGALTGGGTVDAPIGRHPRARKKMAVVPRGGKIGHST